MTGPLILITPDGFRIPAALLSNYYVTGVTVVFNFVSGSASITSTMKDYANALALSKSVDNILQNFTSGVVPVSPNGVVISTCSPSTFVAIGGGTDLYLTGAFTPDIVNGLFIIEDIIGGLDNNGFQFTPVYVDAGNAIATWLNNGDSTVGASMIYYKDSNGLVSNALMGLITS